MTTFVGRFALAATLASIGIATAAAGEPGAIAFAGLKPGDTIAEFLPQANDRSELFCASVGESGHVYSVVPPDEAPREPACANMTTQVLAPRNFHTPELHSDSDDPGWVYEYWTQRSPVESYVSPVPLDVIWVTSRYSELADLRYVHSAWLAALKPGATLIVEERLRRRDAAKVERAVTAAGFEFVARGSCGDLTLLKFRKPGGALPGRAAAAAGTRRLAALDRDDLIAGEL
jgi:hypothetical protein